MQHALHHERLLINSEENRSERLLYILSKSSAIASLVIRPLISWPRSAPRQRLAVLAAPMATPMTRRLAGWSRATLATRSLVRPSMSVPVAIEGPADDLADGAGLEQRPHFIGG